MDHRQRKEVLYLKNRLVREEEQRMLANQRNLSDARKEKLSRNATLIKVLPTPPPFSPNRCPQCGFVALPAVQTAAFVFDTTVYLFVASSVRHGIAPTWWFRRRNGRQAA